MRASTGSIGSPGAGGVPHETNDSKLEKKSKALPPPHPLSLKRPASTRFSLSHRLARTHTPNTHNPIPLGSPLARTTPAHKQPKGARANKHTPVKSESRRPSSSSSFLLRTASARHHTASPNTHSRSAGGPSGSGQRARRERERQERERGPGARLSSPLSLLPPLSPPLRRGRGAFFPSSQMSGRTTRGTKRKLADVVVPAAEAAPAAAAATPPAAVPEVEVRERGRRRIRERERERDPPLLSKSNSTLSALPPKTTTDQAPRRGPHDQHQPPCAQHRPRGRAAPRAPARRVLQAR